MEYDNEMRGALFAAKERKSEKSPPYTGHVTINGKKWRLAAWVEDAKAGYQYFSIKISDPDERREEWKRENLSPDYGRGAAQAKTLDKKFATNLDDEIPF